VAIEFTVILPDQPGNLARLGRALGDARVNIEAFQAYTANGEGVVRFVPADSVGAARALDAGGFRHTSREVLVVDVLDQPGALGDVALVMATAGINIDAAYVTTRGHVVLGVDDLTGAVQVAGGMAVIIGQ
jgi:hypothetical protein